MSFKLRHLVNLRLVYDRVNVAALLDVVIVVAAIHMPLCIEQTCLNWLDLEDAMRVSFCILCQVFFFESRNLFQNGFDVLNSDLAHLISDQQEELASLGVVVTINSCDRAILLQCEVVAPVENTLARIRVRLRQPNVKHTVDVSGKEQREGLEETYNLNLALVSVDLALEDDTFVGPDTHAVVTAARGNQLQIVTVVATDNVFPVAVGLAAHDAVFGLLVFQSLIFVDLDHLVPSTRNNRVILSTVPNVRNFSLLRIVPLDLVRHNSRQVIENLNLALMGAHDELSVLAVEFHARDVVVEYILEHADRFASASVPNLDRLSSSNIDLHSLMTELGTSNRVVIRILRQEWFGVGEYLEVPRAANQATMLGNCLNASDLIDVGDVESLDAAVIQDVPHFDHALVIGCDETVECRKGIDTD